MSQFNLTSKSFTSKPKRGLSLSLQKKKSSDKNETQKDIKQQKGQNLRSFNQSPSSSNRKNRIKFVESYHKNENSSKYEKERFFKNTDEDIKLGGDKNTSSFSRNRLGVRNKLFMNQNMQQSINLQQQQQKSFQFSDRKVLRQSRVVSLTSNINYFQNVNITEQMQQGFQYSGAKKNRQFQGVQLRNKKENSNTSGNAMKVSFEQTNINIKSNQFINQSAMQKLKRVQTNIDQLLQKVSQTRAYLLRCA